MGGSINADSILSYEWKISDFELEIMEGNGVMSLLQCQ